MSWKENMAPCLKRRLNRMDILLDRLECLANRVGMAHPEVPEADTEIPYDQLSIRARRILKNNFSLFLVKDLNELTRDRLLCCKNCGHGTVEEIVCLAKRYGVHIQ